MSLKHQSLPTVLISVRYMMNKVFDGNRLRFVKKFLLDKIVLSATLGIFLCGCSSETEGALESYLREKLDIPVNSYYSKTFEIHDWGEKDTVQLKMQYLGKGKISCKLYSESGKLHGLSHIGINNSDGLPLLLICENFCGFNSIAGSEAYDATGFIQSNLGVWNKIAANPHNTHVSYRAYTKTKKK